MFSSGLLNQNIKVILNLQQQFFTVVILIIASLKCMFSLINISHFSHTVFYRLPKSTLFLCLNTIYKLYRSRLLNQCYNLTNDNHFGGDGRCDSPGYSAKYGIYSLLSAQLNKVIDFHVAHVSIVENSSRMEAEGLKLLLQKYHDITIDTLTTDRHVQVRAFLKKECPQIVHQFDL